MALAARRLARRRSFAQHRDISTLILLRHGTSEWNLLSKWQGQTDTLLAPEGELQARKAGAALAENRSAVC